MCQPDIERREKIQALSLAKDVYNTLLDLLTNANVLKYTMHLVTSHQADYNKQQQQEGKTFRISKSFDIGQQNNNYNEKVTKNVTFEDGNGNEIVESDERTSTIDVTYFN